jgi:hypothetical protein
VARCRRVFCMLRAPARREPGRRVKSRTRDRVELSAASSQGRPDQLLRLEADMQPRSAPLKTWYPIALFVVMGLLIIFIFVILVITRSIALSAPLVTSFLYIAKMMRECLVWSCTRDERKYLYPPRPSLIARFIRRAGQEGMPLTRTRFIPDSGFPSGFGEDGPPYLP